jgi:hypothetical protein
MNHSNASSFGLYEATRIVVPGFYFASLYSFFYYSVVTPYFPFPENHEILVIMYFSLIIVSGLTLYAKETTKRRRAFIENHPSAFLQQNARRASATEMLNDTEARQLYFYILNNFIPPAFYEKVFLFRHGIS